MKSRNSVDEIDSTGSPSCTIRSTSVGTESSERRRRPGKPMPRYLLIELDSNDSADRMRAQIDTAEAAGKGMRVVAMFSKPAALCECQVRSKKSARGAKFGWWLC